MIFSVGSTQHTQHTRNIKKRNPYASQGMASEFVFDSITKYRTVFIPYNILPSPRIKVDRRQKIEKVVDSC